MTKKAKTCLITTVSVLAVISISLSSFASDDNYMPPGSIPNIGRKNVETTGNVHPKLDRNSVFKVKLPEVQKEMYVYRKIPEKLDEQNMKETAALLGMEGCEVSFEGADEAVCFKKCYELGFYRWYNKFRYFNNSKEPGSGIILPDKGELIGTVESYLKEKGLWHDGFEEGKLIDKANNKVYFHHEKFDDDLYTLRSAVATVGPDRILTRLYYESVDAPAYKLVRTITPEEAIERMYKGNVLDMSGEGPYGGPVTIEECELYYESSYRIDRNDKSSTYSPVYRFRGHYGIKDEKGPAFSRSVSAVDDYYLK